jgi:O-succinylbenzoate synthase
VLKVAPLGGISAMLAIATQISIPVVVSSALDSAVGIAAGLRAAAALPTLEHACGLGTGSLLAEDVADTVSPADGCLPVAPATPDPARLAALAASGPRRQWWIDRVKSCYRLLPGSP